MTGMIRSLTSESTILPNAPPMITPTARSTTLPLTANSLNSLANDMDWPPGSNQRCPPPCRRGAPTSDGGLARLPGPNAQDLVDSRHEDLPVTDLARARRLDDRLDRPLDERIGQHHLDLDLGQEIDDVLGTPVELSVPLLPPETLDFGHG